MIGAFQKTGFQFTGFQEDSAVGSGSARLWHSMLWELRRRKRLEEEAEQKKREEEVILPEVTVIRAPLRLVPIQTPVPRVELQAFLNVIDLEKARREQAEFEAFGRFMLRVA